MPDETIPATPAAPQPVEPAHTTPAAGTADETVPPPAPPAGPPAPPPFGPPRRWLGRRPQHLLPLVIVGLVGLLLGGILGSGLTALATVAFHRHHHGPTQQWGPDGRYGAGHRPGPGMRPGPYYPPAAPYYPPPYNPSPVPS